MIGKNFLETSSTLSQTTDMLSDLKNLQHLNQTRIDSMEFQNRSENATSTLLTLLMRRRLKRYRGDALLPLPSPRMMPASFSLSLETKPFFVFLKFTKIIEIISKIVY
jgi:hypothetical protein